MTSPESSDAPAHQTWSRFLWPAIFLLALALFFFLTLVYKSLRVDDTYITFRYSWNIAHGYGIRWNPGEKPVEGCTEFLWMLLSALAIRLGFVPLAAMQVTGSVCAFLTILLPFTPLNRLSTSLRSRFLGAALLAIAPAFAFYGVSGMGHPFFTLLFTISVLLFHRGLLSGERHLAILSGLAFGISTMARPEGFELWMVAIGILAVGLFAARTSLRNLLSFAVAYLVIWVPYTAWRLHYYGYFFPNTYYAKHTGGFFKDLPSGLFYLAIELSLYAALALLCCVLALLPRPQHTSLQRYLQEELPLLAMLTFALTFIGYSTMLGGDDPSPFPSVRLLTPALPILYLLAAESIERLSFRRELNQAIAGLALLVLLFFSQTNDNFTLVKYSHAGMTGTDSPAVVLKAAFQKPPAQNYQVSPLVQWINANLPDHCTVALPWAGVAGWMNKCTLIDEDGLNDAHIAHLPKLQRGTDVKGDAKYILSRHPTLVFVNISADYAKTRSFGSSGGWRISDRQLADALLASPDYKQIHFDADGGTLTFLCTQNCTK